MSFDLFDSKTPEGPFKILTVCTGNVCRSPLAEALLRSSMDGLPVEVSSAGTRALVDSPMTDQNIAIARRETGSEPQPHRARQLRVSHLEEADLVLALSRSHRREAVEILPGVSRYIFTLREFGRLAEALSAEAPAMPAPEDGGARIRESVSFIAQMRGTVPPASHVDDDDVVDPYRRSDEVYEQSAAQILPAVRAIAGLMRTAVGNG